jgi:hypothetical protein
VAVCTLTRLLFFSTKFWGKLKERGANLKGHATRRSWVWQCWVRVVWRGGLHADAVVVFPKTFGGMKKSALAISSATPRVAAWFA